MRGRPFDRVSINKPSWAGQNLFLIIHRATSIYVMTLTYPSGTSSQWGAVTQQQVNTMGYNGNFASTEPSDALAFMKIWVKHGRDWILGPPALTTTLPPPVGVSITVNY